jgi:competence protein ComEC
MTPEGRALNRPKGGGFIAQNWLENDGDPAEQDKAAERWAMLSPASLPLSTVRGKKAAAAPLDCQKARWIVMNADPPEGVPEGLNCDVLHPASLRQTGALAIYKTETGYKEITARQVTGTRLWNAN